MGLFKTVVGGAIGFMVGGPLGAAGGAVLANNIGGKDYKYNINCPSCYKSLGVDSYGDYNCGYCGEKLIFTQEGVIKDTKIDVTCPHCNKSLLVDGPGLWNCCHCKNGFEYGENKIVTKYNEEEETCMFNIFAALAKFCKINGPIKNEHISVMNDIMSNFYELNEDEKKLARKFFRTGRDSNKSFEDFCIKLNNNCYDDNEEDRNVKNGFLHCLYSLATATGKITYEEEKMLNFASGILKIEPYIINEIKSQHLGNSLDKYYEILGCKKGDSLSIIKSNYRKIVSECHPDRIASKDLPDYLVEYSAQRFREVQEAYEKIKLEIGA